MKFIQNDQYENLKYKAEQFTKITAAIAGGDEAGSEAAATQDITADVIIEALESNKTTEVEDLTPKVSELNQTIQQLQTTITDLQAENQDLKSQIVNLKANPASDPSSPGATQDEPTADDPQAKDSFKELFVEGNLEKTKANLKKAGML